MPSSLRRAALRRDQDGEVIYAQAATLGITTFSDLPWNWYFGNDAKRDSREKEGADSPMFQWEIKMSSGHLFLPRWVRGRLDHRQPQKWA